MTLTILDLRRTTIVQLGGFNFASKLRHQENISSSKLEFNIEALEWEGTPAEGYRRVL